jgi:AraC-like DNA-binding protein
MDKLSVFDSARVPHAAIADVELRAPWCVVVPPGNQTFLILVKRGNCVLETGDLDAPLPLRSGDMVTLVAGQRQVWRDSAATPARPTAAGFDAAQKQGSRRGDGARTRLLILSAPRDSNQFVSVYPALVAIPRTERESNSFLRRVIGLIEAERHADRPGKDAVLRRLSEISVIELVRFALPRLPRGGQSWLGGLNDPRVGRAIALMHADLGRQWTLSELARTVGMSRAVFVERFSRLVGEPPNRYLRRVRIHRAATALEETAEAIIRIAGDVGYLSESAFNKAFAKEMGITPARYRRLHRTRG